MLSSASRYEHQNAALEKLFERTGVDVFVATCSMMGSRANPEFESTDEDRVRFRVAAFPTADEWRQLAAAAETY